MGAERTDGFIDLMTAPGGKLLARVDALPATTRDAVRGGTAQRIFKL